MDKILCWNVCGLNWPNKQEDISIFLHQNKVGMVCLLEGKVKVQNVEKITARLFQYGDGGITLIYIPKASSGWHGNPRLITLRCFTSQIRSFIGWLLKQVQINISLSHSFMGCIMRANNALCGLICCLYIKICRMLAV